MPHKRSEASLLHLSSCTALQNEKGISELQDSELTRHAHCLAYSLVGERLHFLHVMANKLSLWPSKPNTMRVFEVNVPAATLLRAVIKHIINQLSQNSLPRFKTHSCKVSLSKKEQQDNPFKFSNNSAFDCS